MESRELQLESCLRRLLSCTELNLDDLEEESRAAIRQALMVADAPSSAPEIEELVNTLTYIGELVEAQHTVLQGLVEEVAGLKKAVLQARQGALF